MKYSDYDFEADITAISNSNNKYQAIVKVNYTLSNQLQLGENKLLDMQWDSEDDAIKYGQSIVVSETVWWHRLNDRTIDGKHNSINYRAIATKIGINEEGKWLSAVQIASPFDNGGGYGFEYYETAEEALNEAVDFAKSTIDLEIQNMLNCGNYSLHSNEIADREFLLNEWQLRLDKAMTEIDDYDVIVNATDTAVSDYVREFILHSDVGPELLYKLAKNDKLIELLDISNLDDLLVLLLKMEYMIKKSKWVVIES